MLTIIKPRPFHRAGVRRAWAVTQIISGRRVQYDVLAATGREATKVVRAIPSSQLEA